MLISLYKILTNTLFPLVADLYLQKRLKKKKEIEHRLPERKGISSLQKPSGPLIWVHCASVGEANSILVLIDRIHQVYPDIHFLVTTGTITSATLMAQKLPSYAFHQFLPLDVGMWIRRFLDHWRPDLILWVESELWPNTLEVIQERKIPLYLINARMSDRSYKRWLYLKSTAKELLSSFAVILAQSQESAERFLNLAGKNVVYTGNLKFAAPTLPAEEDRLDAFRKACEGRQVLLFSSTHPGEEEKAVEVRNYLVSEHPNLLTIIAPRHPHRASELMELLSLHGKVETLSSKKPPSSSCDFYLVDGIGELGLFYRLCPIVFMGGSWVPRGGHNPIEPAQLNCVLFHGPHTHNFREVYHLFEENSASLLVEAPSGLSENIASLLKDPNKLRALQMRSFEVILHHRTSLDAVMGALSPALAQLRRMAA